MNLLYEQNQNLPTVMTTSKQQTIIDTARRLFREHGFSAVSVGSICAEASVSRVTFYKYYSGKNALLQEIVTEQKNCVRAEFENLLARQCSLREAAEAVFALQKQSFEELYSAAFLRDIEENTDLELERFFHELNEEKYAFMRGFFHTLQQRRLIQPDLPVELIDLFIRQADILMRHPQLVALYAAAPQKLPQDVLGLLLHGLSGKE
ncbi:Bacterial regulatory proteins, tetR family [Neisseria subflava]|uniref:Bacterial regulatory proteins, tetR family n=1 Tax=Neisseria subflava TaxID=28449 RepID=A0A9X9QY81_NEISU|nr:TetR/AcrR family transcriptional regulator [Neisseria subflava]VTY05993.1 Bacterial regulatory proteins, tetR family [Neisseria subflava]